MILTHNLDYFQQWVITQIEVTKNSKLALAKYYPGFSKIFQHANVQLSINKIFKIIASNACHRRIELVETWITEFLSQMRAMFQSEAEFKALFIGHIDLQPATFVKLLKCETEIIQNPADIEGMFIMHDIYDKYIRLREKKQKLLQVKCGKKKNNYTGIVGICALKCFEKFKYHALTYRAPELVTPSNRSRLTKAANDLAIEWMADNLDPRLLRTMLSCRAFEAAGYLYRHVQNLEMKVELSINFITGYSLDEMLEGDLGELWQQILNGFDKNIYAHYLIKEYVESCERLQKKWPLGKYYEISRQWIASIQDLRNQFSSYKSISQYIQLRYVEVGGEIHNAIISETVPLPRDLDLYHYKKSINYLVLENDLHSFSKETWEFDEADKIVNIVFLLKKLNTEWNWQQVIFELEKTHQDMCEFVYTLKSEREWDTLFEITEGTAEYHRSVPRYWDHMIKLNRSTLILPNPTIVKDACFKGPRVVPP